MHRIRGNPTKRLAVIALMVIASALLAACGSSSSASTTASSTAAAAKTPAGTRFAALRECLKKNGITLPQRTPGTTGQRHPPTGGAFPLGGGGAGGFAGGAHLPSGVTRAQYEAALKKCGGGVGRFGPRARLNSASFKKSLESFSACMRQSGINLPAPNTSGSGPIFDTKGLDTTSAAFRSAQSKCASLLAFRRPGTPGPPAGAPETAG
ncbi:MAG: hypothetical protein ACLQBB_12055 [Solirubrobacteraceae bacterium]